MGMHSSCFLVVLQVPRSLFMFPSHLHSSHLTSTGFPSFYALPTQADENDDGGGEETLGSLFLLDAATSSGGGICWEEPVSS